MSFRFPLRFRPPHPRFGTSPLAENAFFCISSTLISVKFSVDWETILNKNYENLGAHSAKAILYMYVQVACPVWEI